MLNDSKCALLIGAQSRAFRTPVLDNSGDGDSLKEVFTFQ